MKRLEEQKLIFTKEIKAKFNHKMLSKLQKKNKFNKSKLKNNQFKIQNNLMLNKLKIQFKLYLNKSQRMK